MAKAEKKQLPSKKEVPTGMSAKDLSVEKREELFQEAMQTFLNEAGETYGLTIDVQLIITRRGIVPRLVYIDLLKNTDGKQAETKK